MNNSFFLLWLLRLYPRAFRARFEVEMTEMLGEAREEVTGRHGAAVFLFSLREAAGILRGVTREWLAVGWMGSVRLAERSGHWPSAVALALAAHCLAYAALVPIGPSAAAAASSGWGPYWPSAVCAGFAVAMEASRSVLARDWAEATRRKTQ